MQPSVVEYLTQVRHNLTKSEDVAVNGSSYCGAFHV